MIVQILCYVVLAAWVVAVVRRVRQRLLPMPRQLGQLGAGGMTEELAVVRRRLGMRPKRIARCTADALAMHEPGKCEECDYDRATGESARVSYSPFCKHVGCKEPGAHWHTGDCVGDRSDADWS